MKLVLALLLALALPAHAQEVPEWFTESFLELREDVAEAKQGGRRVMLFFWQDGCPACRRLSEVTFRDPAIAARMKRGFMPIALNIFGAREVTWTDGRKMTEKELAAMLKLRATPTLVFLDEKGAVGLRLEGYLAPPQFAAALDKAGAR